MTIFTIIALISIAVASSIIGAVGQYNKENGLTGNVAEAGAIGFLIGMTIDGVFLFAALFMSSVCGTTDNYQLTNEQYVPLYGISNSSQVKGGAIIGCGRINAEQYIFYNTMEGHELKTNTVKRKNASIFVYDTIQEPYATVFYKVCVHTPNMIGKMFFKHIAYEPSDTIDSYMTFYLNNNNVYQENNYDIRDF